MSEAEESVDREDDGLWTRERVEQFKENQRLLAMTKQTDQTAVDPIGDGLYAELCALFDGRAEKLHKVGGPFVHQLALVAADFMRRKFTRTGSRVGGLDEAMQIANVCCQEHSHSGNDADTPASCIYFALEKAKATSLATGADDFQRGYEQAREDAAKAICGSCRVGTDLHFQDAGKVWIHTAPSGQWAICKATDIRALAPPPPTTQQCKLGEPMMHGPQPYKWCETHNRLMMACEMAQRPAGLGAVTPLVEVLMTARKLIVEMDYSVRDAVYAAAPNGEADAAAIKVLTDLGGLLHPIDTKENVLALFDRAIASVCPVCKFHWGVEVHSGQPHNPNCPHASTQPEGDCKAANVESRGQASSPDESANSPTPKLSANEQWVRNITPDTAPTEVYDDSDPVMAALDMLADDTQATDNQRRVARAAMKEIKRLRSPTPTESGSAPDIYAKVRDNGWLPIEFCNPEVPMLLYSPPEQLHLNPEGRQPDIRFAKPRDFTYATHGMSVRFPTANLLTEEEAQLVIGAIPLQSLPAPTEAEEEVARAAAWKILDSPEWRGSGDVLNGLTAMISADLHTHSAALTAKVWDEVIALVKKYDADYRRVMDVERQRCTTPEFREAAKKRIKAIDSQLHAVNEIIAALETAKARAAKENQ